MTTARAVVFGSATRISRVWRIGDLAQELRAKRRQFIRIALTGGMQQLNVAKHLLAQLGLRESRIWPGQQHHTVDDCVHQFIRAR